MESKSYLRNCVDKITIWSLKSLITTNRAVQEASFISVSSSNDGNVCSIFISIIFKCVSLLNQLLNVGLLSQKTMKHKVIIPTKNILLIDNYMKSFLSNTNEMISLQTVFRKFISTRRNRLNKKSILLRLPNDIIKYIILFVTICDYSFGILQISQHFCNNFSPHKVTHIMRDLIKNEWSKMNGYKYNKSKYLSLVNQWEMTGFYAWNCYCKQGKQLWKNVKNAHIKIIKNKWLCSYLFLLHFMYKCQYGGIEKSIELRRMLLKIISLGSGVLGIRYMICFYSKQFVFNQIQHKFDLNYKNIILCGENKIKRTIADLLSEICDDETFLKFTYGLRKLIVEQEDKLLITLLNQMMNEYTNLSSIYGFTHVFGNIKTTI